MSDPPERRKRHLPPGVRTGAAAVAAVAGGVVLPAPVAWAVLALAVVVIALDLAGTRTAQEWVPGLGRLPLVRDHELERQPARPRGAARAVLPAGADSPSEEHRLADEAERRAAELRALCAEWKGRMLPGDEVTIAAEGQERVNAANSGCLAAYYEEHSVETERIFVRLVEHGVIDHADSSLVEEPRFPADIVSVAKRLRTGAKRLRVSNNALAEWLDVHAAVIDRLEAVMRSYAEQEETDAEAVVATNQEFRLTYGAVLRRVGDDAPIWMEHIGSFPLWSDPDLSGGTTPDQADKAARLYAWINRRVKNIAEHVRDPRGDPARVELDASEVAAFKDFAHDFAGWLKSHEIEAPPDMTSALGDEYEREQTRRLLDDQITPQEYRRNIRPLTEHREWAKKVRAEYHRDWRTTVARNLSWARQSGAMKRGDVAALFVVTNPHGDDLHELAGTIERIADRL